MITAGHHVYAGSDGTWRHSAPGDRFERLVGPDDLLALLQRVAHGATALDDVAGEQRARLQDVLAVFGERGLLSPPLSPSREPDTAGTVRSIGDGPLSTQVVELLEHAGVSVVGDGDVSAADVVVTCGGRLPDSAWLELDSTVREAGIPWHMAYLDADGAVVGPMYVPSRTASYRDVRARRLAASGVPAELRSYWAYLESSAPKPPVEWPDPGGLAVVAGLVAADVLAYLRGAPLPGSGCQIVVSRALEVVRHPVLPLPW